MLLVCQTRRGDFGYIGGHMQFHMYMSSYLIAVTLCLLLVKLQCRLSKSLNSLIVQVIHL